MNLTIYLPGLLEARGASAGEHPIAHAAALQLRRFLAKASSTPLDPGDAGFMQPLPGAAGLAAKAHGLPAGHWLCASPVELSADHRGIYLLGNESLALSDVEVAALAASLNAFLAEDGLQLYAPEAHHWYLRGDAPIALETTPLAQVLGKDIAAYQPGGADARHWQRLATELAMLLHGHPVNEARRADGRATVAGLWLWGEGEGSLPAPARAVYSDEAAVRGWTGGAVLSEAEGLWRGGFAGDAAVHSAALARAMREGDVAVWLARVAEWDALRFGPALAALAQGRLAELRLLPGNGRQYRLRSSDLRKFWRRPKPLTHYLGDAS
ncbi:MAG: hypothetical protein HYV16_03480 [Gammaproteobacteria bacterium]|nr:hypothetical protein [Gammaproteobacteria bacterium]